MRPLILPLIKRMDISGRTKFKNITVLLKMK